MHDEQSFSATLIKLAESMEALSDALRVEESREKTASRGDFEIGTVGTDTASDVDPLTSYLLS